MEADKNVVVVDHGSDTIKAGYANYPERGPQLVRLDPPPLSSSVRQDASPGRLTLSRIKMQILPSLVTAIDDGAALETAPDPDKMLRPIRHGIVQDWEMMESIYNYMLYEQAYYRAHNFGSVNILLP